MINKSISIFIFSMICFSISYADEPKIENWPNGKKKIESEMKNGLKNGKSMSWYENGAKESEEEFKDNIRNGKTIFWYENGKLRSDTEYKEGKINALSVHNENAGMFTLNSV